MIVYSYDVHGVNYTAAQDVPELRLALAADPERAAGPIAIKFQESRQLGDRGRLLEWLRSSLERRSE